MSTVIKVENLSKRYRLGVINRDMLYKDLQSRWAKLRGKEDPNATIGHKHDKRLEHEDEFWALRNVDLEVKEGEILGIIGRNGAGKSTLLKILSQITAPTEGRIKVKGRIASLLEVGTGFHPELTGRENVYLNGAILGMTRKEVRSKFDEIVAFAEIDEFIDTPVKRYSSGMYVRLAFAVAAHLDPEILIVDEVLAVGDAEFQAKCLGRMRTVAQGGRTVLFVSHNLAAIKLMCSQSILLIDGRVERRGPSNDVASLYLATTAIEAGRTMFVRPAPAAAHVPVYLSRAWLSTNAGSSDRLNFGEPALLNLEIYSRRSFTFSIEVVLKDDNGTPIMFSPSGLAFDKKFTTKSGIACIEGHIPPLKLASGSYSLDVLVADTGREILDANDSAIQFHVATTSIGCGGWRFEQKRGQGSMLWEIDFQTQPAPINK